MRYCIYLVALSSFFPLTSAHSQWQPLGLDSLRVFSLAASSSAMFAGTDQHGVYRSTNGGISWSQSNSGLHDSFAKTLEMGGSRIYSGSNRGGASVSTNDGVSWQNISAGLPPPGTGVHVISVSGGVAFAGTNGRGVFRSTNNGATWDSVNTGLGNRFVHAMTVNSGNLYAGTGNSVSEGGIYLSSNNGASWTLTSGAIVSAVRSLATTGNMFIAGCNGTGVFVSFGGQTWDQRNNGLANTNVRAVALYGNMAFTSILAGTNGGGIFLSENSGSTWRSINDGLGNLSILSLLVAPPYVYAGTFAGVWRRPVSQLVSVDETSPELPSAITLLQNYPNPFNPATTIRFELPATQHITIKVFDMLGTEVATLVDGIRNAGSHNVLFDASGLASGVYLCRLQAGSASQSRKLILSR